MPQDYKDATYSANTGLNGQVTPTLYSAPGVLCSSQQSTDLQISQPVTAYTTGAPGTSPGFSSITSAEQTLAVGGQVYQSPGGVLNKDIGYMTTGGGP